MQAHWIEKEKQFEKIIQEAAQALHEWNTSQLFRHIFGQQLWHRFVDTVNFNGPL